MVVVCCCDVELALSIDNTVRAAIMPPLAKPPSNVLCVARNYVAHIKELQNERPTQPFFFLKPTSSVVTPPSPIVLPLDSDNVHHELEVAAVIGKTLRKVRDRNEASEGVAGYRLCLDLTARDLQEEAKKKGHPWTKCKGFDTFLPLGPYVPKTSELERSLASREFWLRVNGSERQRGTLSQMIFDIPELIIHATRFMTLVEGDLLLTGTPSGVAALKAGDSVEFGGLSSDAAARFNVVRESD